MADTYPCNWPRLPERVILDEVQRVPGIFSTLKSAVDRRRVAGRYPAALVRSGARRRGIWYRDYIETLVQRDVRDLARIASLDRCPCCWRLLPARRPS